MIAEGETASSLQGSICVVIISDGRFARFYFTFEMVFNNKPRGRPADPPKVMRPGPKKRALAGPWLTIKR